MLTGSRPEPHVTVMCTVTITAGTKGRTGFRHVSAADSDSEPRRATVPTVTEWQSRRHGRRLCTVALHTVFKFHCVWHTGRSQGHSVALAP
jgi:hypothetical protein